MWHAFIEFGGTLFWIILGAIVALELAFVAKEKIGWSFGVAGSFLVGLSLFTSFDVRGFLATGWKNFLIALAAYVVAGVVWSVIRWVIYARKRKTFLQEHLDEFRLSRCNAGVNIPKEFRAWPQEEKAEFLVWFARDWNSNSNEDLRGGGYKNHISIDNDLLRSRNSRTPEFTEDGVATATKLVMAEVMPLARHEKGRISLWISFWPFSIACYCLQDLVVDACKAIVKAVTSCLHNITKAVFSGVRKDMGVQ